MTRKSNWFNIAYSEIYTPNYHLTHLITWPQYFQGSFRAYEGTWSSDIIALERSFSETFFYKINRYGARTLLGPHLAIKPVLNNSMKLS